MIWPFGKNDGGLHTLQLIAGDDQPPLAVHERVVGVPKKPFAQRHVYCEAPGCNVGVTEP